MSGERNQEVLAQALARETAGERLAWQARRIARVSWRGFAIYLFAVPWTAFALFWTAMAAGGVLRVTGAVASVGALAWAFPLFGLPFIAIGLTMLALPFQGLWAGSRTLYAATDKRLLKLTLFRGVRTESVDLRRLGTLTRTERPDGSGSISYILRVFIDSDGDRSVERFAIDDIPDVLEASRRIERARTDLSS